MLRYRLRTLLIVLALGPPVLAIAIVFLMSYFSGPALWETDIKTGPWPETPLQLYSYKNDIAGMRKELGKSALIDEPDTCGLTALHWAVKGNSRNAVQVLLESGAGEDIRDDFGYLPIDYADDQAVRALLDNSGKNPATVEVPAD